MGQTDPQQAASNPDYSRQTLTSLWNLLRSQINFSISLMGDLSLCQ